MSSASSTNPQEATATPVSHPAAGVVLVVKQLSVEMPADCWQKMLAVLSTPTGDNLKREILTKMLPELYGARATLPSMRPGAAQVDAGGDGLSSATAGHAAIEGGKHPVKAAQFEDVPLLCELPEAPLPPPEDRADLHFEGQPGKPKRKGAK